MTQDRPPTRQRSKRLKGARSAARSDPPASESPSEWSALKAAPLVVANNRTTGGSRATHSLVCPKCHGRFVRMHRRFGDRVLSMFKPVRRYRCTNHLCRHEAILGNSPSFAQRPIVAAVGLAGAAFAGALVTGIGLYLASDDSTRAQVRGVYTSMAPHDGETRPDATLLFPLSRHEPNYETAPMLEVQSQSGELTVGFVPPVPVLAPAANAGVDESR